MLEPTFSYINHYQLQNIKHLFFPWITTEQLGQQIYDFLFYCVQSNPPFVFFLKRIPSRCRILQWNSRNVKDNTFLQKQRRLLKFSSWNRIVRLQACYRPCRCVWIPSFLVLNLIRLSIPEWLKNLFASIQLAWSESLSEAFSIRRQMWWVTLRPNPPIVCLSHMYDPNTSYIALKNS